MPKEWLVGRCYYQHKLASNIMWNVGDIVIMKCKFIESEKF